MVGDPLTLQPVPSGQRKNHWRNIHARQYCHARIRLKNPRATNEAFADDWLRTGDLGVMHENGYIEVKTA